MKKIASLMLIGLCFCLMANAATDSQNNLHPEKGFQQMNTFKQISQDEAKRIMEESSGYIIVDARRYDEYIQGHIPGAVLIPNESIDTQRPSELKDLNQMILVYCRSGNRSKMAALKLAAMGYTNILEFGGINTWDGPIEK